MSSKAPRYRSAPPPSEPKHSAIRRINERRQADRVPSDSAVEILKPVYQRAMALNVSTFGMRLALPGWLSTGTVCDLRVTTHSGRQFSKRARVVWTRRAADGCIAGLRITGTLSRDPHAR